VILGDQRTTPAESTLPESHSFMRSFPESALFTARHSDSFFFRPRPPAKPALRAISERCSGVRFWFRFFAPRLPSATAAGFFFAISA
jgi:hypothetical protein